MKKTISQYIHPLFIALVLAWVSTLLFRFIDDSVFPYLGGHVFWQPGLSFGLAVSLVMKKPWRIPVFATLSAGVYFMVAQGYAQGIYGGPGVWYLWLVFIAGALIELLLFAGVYGFFKKLRIGHFVGALAAAGLGLLITGFDFYVAFLVWYISMGTTFYFLMKENSATPAQGFS